MRALPLSLVVFCTCSLAFADGPADNNPLVVRRLPKLGIEVPAEKRSELEAGLAKLQAAMDALAKKNDAKTIALLPDVRIFHKAVHDALKYQEFHDIKELDEATRQLSIGQQRADSLLKGEAPWMSQTGLVVRGYISKIDGSVQPYGMVVPETYTNQTPVGYRCDVWLHGRGETLTELNFIKDRLNNPGIFTPARTLVLHPYGRWNNAFKFAGEVDVFEALDSAKQRYAIDDDRVSIRGFSMGGAGAWHLAVHHPDRWFAANPGAGFSETPEFLKVFQKEDLSGKPWWEERLWLMYDCNQWAHNLVNCPTLAYSGEVDRQKQAADVMELALKPIDRQLIHIIGPKTAHSYHADSKLEVDGRLAQIDKQRRPGPRRHIAFGTWTLRYNQCDWLVIDELSNHWRDGVVIAELGHEMESLKINAAGIEAFTLRFPPGSWKRIEHSGNHPFFEINRQFGEELGFFPYQDSDGSLEVSYHLVKDKWKLGKRPTAGLRKKHGLQGPIDDAFMESFLMVRPSGKAAHPIVEKWTTSECDRAIEQWRRHFRGEARVKKDTEVSDEDIAKHNLVLWGDPSSNAVLAKIADKLPIQWGKDRIRVEEHGDYNAELHAVIAIYPNPLNPEKYVVLNSGFTFREYAHLNNARQVPMLPDWAIVDLTTPAGNVWPGKIVAADFFDEQWKLKKSEH